MIRSARFASASRPLALRSTICWTSSMSWTLTPATSRQAGSMSRGTAMSIISSGRSARCCHHLLEPVALDDVVRRVGRGDDDVGLDQLLGQLLEADGAATEALGEADRAVVVAVGDEDGADAAGDQGAGDQLGGLAGADHQHPALGEVAERAPRQLDRDRGDRDALLADPGLLAGAAAGG